MKNTKNQKRMEKLAKIIEVIYGLHGEINTRDLNMAEIVGLEEELIELQYAVASMANTVRVKHCYKILAQGPSCETGDKS